MKYAHIMARVLNQPVLVTPEYMQVFLGSINDRLNIDAVYTDSGSVLTAHDLQARADSYSVRSQKPYQVTDDGIAMIPISGALVHKSAPGLSTSDMSYEALEASLMSAAVDDDVKGIMLDVDSPGGEVAGLFDFVDQIKEAKTVKPVWAFVGEQSASAAFAIASVADKVLIPRTGMAGSVGAVIAHNDQSQRLEKQGIKVTLIHSGAHKVDGNSFQPLSKEVKASLKAELDSIREMFANLVAEGRGIDVKAVLDTEAKMYRGQAAVDVGFADEVMSFNDAYKAFVELFGKEDKPALRAAATTEPTISAEIDEIVEDGDMGLTTELEVQELQLNLTDFFDSIDAQTIATEMDEIRALAKLNGLDETALLDNISSPSDLVRLTIQSCQTAHEAEIDSTVSPGNTSESKGVLKSTSEYYEARK